MTVQLEKRRAFVKDAREYVKLGELLLLTHEKTLTQWRGMWDTADDDVRWAIHDELRTKLTTRRNDMIRLARQVKQRDWPKETVESVHETIIGYLAGEVQVSQPRRKSFAITGATKIRDLRLKAIQHDDFFDWVEREFGVYFHEEFSADTVGDLLNEVERIMRQEGRLPIDYQPGRMYRPGHEPLPIVEVMGTNMTGMQIVNRLFKAMAEKFEMYAAHHKVLAKTEKGEISTQHKIKKELWEEAAKELRKVADDESHTMENPKQKKGKRNESAHGVRS